MGRLSSERGARGRLSLDADDDIILIVYTKCLNLSISTYLILTITLRDRYYRLHFEENKLIHNFIAQGPTPST